MRRLCQASKYHLKGDVTFVKAGLNAMWEEGSVFGCYTSMWDVIYYSELGSSWAVLAAGYTIDCLMMRYQSIDWTDLDTWDCNSRSVISRR